MRKISIDKDSAHLKFDLKNGVVIDLYVNQYEDVEKQLNEYGFTLGKQAEIISGLLRLICKEWNIYYGHCNFHTKDKQGQMNKMLTRIKRNIRFVRGCYGGNVYCNRCDHFGKTCGLVEETECD